MPDALNYVVQWPTEWQLAMRKEDFPTASYTP